jgi:thiol:disulfide interchange protein DsbA
MNFKRFLLILAACVPLAAGAAEPFTEGVHYARITPAQPSDAAPGKVQITELFWYGCPHCYEMEPTIQAWLRKKPASIEFRRMPAVFRTNLWHVHAKAFYAAEALGVLDRVHNDLFAAIHDRRQMHGTEDQLAQFFADRGVPAADFRAAFNSFAVETKVNRSMALSKAYGITGVPVLVVAGKYRVEGDMAGSYENMIRIAEYLALREGRGAR